MRIMSKTIHTFTRIGIQMRRIYERRIIINSILLVIFTTLILTCFATDTTQLKRILYINSFNTNAPTYSEHLNGINSVFKNHDLRIDYEFMDSKNLISEEIESDTKNYLLNKISKLEPYDLIMVSDDPAFEFIQENISNFRDIPIVFFAVNNRKDALELAKSPIITGVTERVSVLKTVSLIERLRPNLESIHLIIDGVDLKFLNEKQMLDELNRFGIKKRIIRTDKYSWEEMRERLESIPEDDALVCVSAYHDKNKVVNDFYRSFQLIKESTSAPIFHLWPHGIGKGFLGGYVVSHYTQAENAAKLAIRMILNNEKDIPVIDTESNNYCLVDYKLAEAYNIDTSKLPANVRYINKPVTIWRRYGLVMVVVSVLMILELVLIIALSYYFLQRKKYLLESQQNEEKLRITLQSIGDAVIATDITGKITMMNIIAEKLTGWKRNEAIGKDVSDVFNIVNATDNSKIANPVTQVLESRGVIGLSNNTKLRSKDGKDYLITDRAAPILNIQGEIEGVVMVFQDATSRKQQDQIIKESEKQLNMFFNQSLSAFFLLELEEPVCITDGLLINKLDTIINNLKFAKINNALADMYKLDRGSLIGKQMINSKSCPLERKELLLEVIENVSLSKITVEHDSSGETLWVHGYYSLVKDQEGRMIGLFGTQYNVTEKYLKEQKIKSLLEIQKGILNNIMSSAVVKDIDDDFRILHWNKFIENYTGISAEQAIGKTDFELFPDEQARYIRKKDLDVLASPLHKTYYEERISGKQGLSRIFKTIKSIVPKDNSTGLLLSFSFDIDDLKKAQIDLLAAKEKAETADRLKSAFLANMSHEIRTPLNSIVGFSYLLSVSEDNNESEEFYDIIKNNTDLLLTLINDIVDYSKIESGNLSLVEENCNIHACLENCVNTIKQKVPEDIELILDLPSEEPIFVISDSQRLQQIMLNLLTNSVKHTDKGHIKAGYHIEQNHIQFYFEDTGTGIAKELQGKIFERFFKADEFKQGTGLGLAVCKLLLDAFGGKIWLESEVGKGTTFYFTIPFVPADKPKEQTVDFGSFIQIPVREADKKTLLIAEDTSSNYHLLQTVLGKSYKLIHAINGKEAIELFDKHSPDAILMDLKMPVMDGFEATKEIRAKSESIPIIAITAYAYDTDKVKAMDAGCNDYIPKPIDVKSLRRILGKYLY